MRGPARPLSLAAAFLLLPGLLLTGCAAPPQTAALVKAPLTDLPTQALLTDIPFFPQAAYQCGPAALAMSMAGAGVAVDPDALVAQVYLPARQGSLQPELVATTRRHGLAPYVLAPQLSDLLREVAAGNPVVVLQNLGLSAAPVWHYAVVVGFDRERKELILHSGVEARQRLDLALFERTWARGNHWALLTLPPSRLPATVTPEKWFATAVDLERTKRPAAALDAYQAALGRWPDHLTALMGYGNAAVALQRLDDAAHAFQRATERHPEAAVAFNNLAYTLALMGRREAALSAARQAVALGGEHAVTFAATLREIEQDQLGPTAAPPSE